MTTTPSTMDRDSTPGDTGECENGEPPRPMSEALEKVEDQSRQNVGQTVQVRDLLDALGQRAYGPLLLIPSLLTLVPIIGAIPGLPMVMAVWILVIAVQILIGRKYFWLPKRLLDLGMDADKVQKGVEKVMSPVQWLEKFIHPRMPWLCHRPVSFLTALLVTGLALSMFPLEFIPFGVSPAAFTIFILAIGITAGDGLFVLGGFFLTLLTAALTWCILPF